MLDIYASSRENVFDIKEKDHVKVPNSLTIVLLDYDLDPTWNYFMKYCSYFTIIIIILYHARVVTFLFHLVFKVLLKTILLLYVSVLDP